jgi:DNA-binding SARP family transcriptional activator/WD40 repeat protein
MELRILGPVEVTGSGGSIRLGSRRERAVLAALVIGGGDVVSSDRLIDALWGEAPPRSATKTLQNYILRLRKAIGPAAIETQTPGYRLATGDVSIDVQRFDNLIRASVTARAERRPADAARLGREALALWRGTPLEELSGWAAADAEADRLNELRRATAEEIIDAELACGHAATLVAELESMVAAEPLRERRWAMLMLALYRDGRQAEALRAFQRARTLLGDELGIEPGPELRELERAVAGHDPALDLPRRSAGSPGMVDRGPEPDALGADPPYKGLAAFEPDDRDLFFGRADLVEALVRRAERARFVALVGASGSGKSSVVRAGVLGTFRAGAADRQPRHGFVMTPGVHPLVQLRTGIAAAGAGPLVVVVDQFEELFTQVEDVAERSEFLDVLLGAADDESGSTAVVVALRADFYGHCVEHPRLAAWLDRESTLLCPMTPDEVRSAIEGPATHAGLQVESGLIEIVLRDVGAEPGALPLLSHALYETWKRRSNRTLTVAGYQESGGVRGAIAQSAETVHRSLDPEQQRRARQIFLRLTEVGDGTDDLRRRVARTELLEPADGRATAWLLRTLADARLITIDDEAVQLAHEALLREWPRLRRWLDEDREGRRIHRHLTRASAEWEGSGRDALELYRGARLATARRWASSADHQAELNALERSFLRASAAREAAEQQRERDRVQARDRSHHRTRRLLACTALLLTLALIAGAVALVQRNRADEEAEHARRATSNADIARLVAQSAALRHENPFVSSLLAVEANERRDDSETQGELLASVISDPRRIRTLPTGSSEGVWRVPGTARVLVLSRGRLTEWDAGTGRRAAVLPGAHVETAAVRGDGLIAVAHANGTVTFIGADRHRTGPTFRSGMHGSIANAVFSPDGSQLALAYSNWADPHPVGATTTVRLYDVDGRRNGPRVEGPIAPVTALAYSPDGGRLAVGTAAGRVGFRDARTGRRVGPELTMAGPPTGLAFDPVRDRLAIGTTATGVDVVDAMSGAPVARLADAPAVDVPRYDAGGTRLAVAGDGPVRLYDAASLAPLPASRPSRVQPGDPMDAQTTPARVVFMQRGRLVVGGGSGPATVWDPDGITSLASPVPGASSYVFPMVGRPLLAVPDLADAVTLVDLRTRRPGGPPLSPGPGKPTTVVYPTTFAASYFDGGRIAVVNRSGLLQLYDVDHRTPIGGPIATGIVPMYAVFSRDMRRIAVGGRQGEVRLVDLRTRSVRALPSPMSNLVLGLEFGPGDLLAASDWGHVVLYSRLSSDTPRVRDMTPIVGGGGLGMDLSPDGRLLAVSDGGDVAFYDARTLRPDGPRVPADRDLIAWIAFDRSGTRLVTGDLANTARLVDVVGRRPIGPVLENTVAAPGAVFSHDGKTLGTWTFGGGALLSVDPAAWRRAACALAGRNLTRDEWALYLPHAGPRRRTCPQFP